MEITLNNIEYTAPVPVTGIWFAIQKLKTVQEKRVVEITKMWDGIKLFEGKEDLDEVTIDKLEKAMITLNKKNRGQ